MALRVRRSSSAKVRFITTLMMAAALVAQPFAGFMHSRVANAVEAPEHVVLNEVHPGGVNTPRWVELYNPTSSEVSLADWRITHDDVAKSYFGGVFGENVIIPAHGYYVQDDESGNPTLSLSGSTLHLQKALGAEDTDTLTYPALDAGQSYGRSQDGSETKDTFSAATVTKGAANYVKPVVPTFNPAITPAEFTTINDTGNYYKGIDVGFSLNDDFGSLELLKVELFDANGVVATNAATQQMLNYYNGGGRSFTTPFVVEAGKYNPAGDGDAYWSFSDYTWNKNDTPTKVTITAKGSNGDAVTVKNENLTLGGGNFADLFPAEVVPTPPQKTIAVSSDNSGNWQFVKEKGTDATGAFVSNPGENGSVRLATSEGGSTQAISFGTYADQYVGLKLNDIRELGYDTYVDPSSNGSAQNISLQFNIDLDGTDNDTSYQGRLTYEPYFTHTVKKGEWQTWNTLDNAGQGNWWFSKAPGNSVCSQDNPCTWNEVKAAYPHASLNQVYGGIVLQAGSFPEANFAASVDKFHIATATLNNLYDFEAAPQDTIAPQTPKLLSPGTRTYSKTNDFYFTWSDVSDSGSAVSYEFQSDDNDGFTHPWDSVANGNSEQKNLTTPKIHSTGAPDGTYYWRVRALDAAGNKSAWTAPWKMTIDTHAPSTDIAIKNEHNSYVSTQKSSSTLTVTGHATDNLQLNRVYIQVVKKSDSSRKAVNVNLIPEGNDASWKADFNTKDLHLEDGKYMAIATVVDMAGNSITTEYVDFTLDNTRPVVEFTAPADFSKPFRVLPRIAIEVSDLNGSGVSADDGVIHVYNADTNEPTSAWCANSASCDTSGLVTGNYYVKAGISDVAGNNQTATKYFVIDNTAPEASLSVNPIGGGTVKVTGSVDPSEQHMQSHWFEITDPNGGKTYNTSGLNKGGNEWSFEWDTSVLLNGKYTIRYVATDSLGNRSDDPHYSNPTTVTYDVQNIVATPTVMAPAVDGATVKSAGYVVRGQAPGAKAVYVCVTPKESAAVSVLEVSQGDCHDATLMTDGSWSSDISSFLSDKKSYTLSFYAQDAAGNRSEYVARTISVDNTEKASSDGSGSTNDGTKNETVDNKAQPVVTPQRSTGNSPTSSPNLLAVNSFQAAANQSAADDVAVLGAETTKNDDTSADDAAVLGESDTAAATAAQTPAKDASTIFGLAWYWWFVVLAVIASILYAVARRRNQNA